MTNTAIQQQPTITPCYVQRKELLAALKFVQYAQSREKTRFYLNGVYFDKQAGKALTIVTTDGHRLHKVTIGLATDAAFAFIIPSAAIKNMIKTLTSGKVFETVALKGFNDVNRLHMQFNGQDDKFYLYDAIDARFPDYMRVIPSATERATFGCYNARYIADTMQAFTDFAKIAGYRYCAVNGFSEDALSPVVFKPSAMMSGLSEFDLVTVIMPMRD